MSKIEAAHNNYFTYVKGFYAEFEADRIYLTMSLNF